MPLPILYQSIRSLPDGTQVPSPGCTHLLTIEFDYTQDPTTFPCDGCQPDLLTCVLFLEGDAEEQKSGAADGCVNDDVYASTDHSLETAGKILTHVDVFAALNDGRWMSSTVLKIHVEHSSGIGHDVDATIKATLAGITQTKAVTATEASDPCPCNVASDAALVATLTVFDDGTFSLA